MQTNPELRLPAIGLYPVGSSVATDEGLPTDAAPSRGMTELDDLLIPLWTSHPATRWLGGLR